MGNLNQKKVRETTKPGRYGDGGCLYLHVRRGGSRQWLLRTTVCGKRTDIGLGSVEYISLAEARDTAYEMRRKAKQGIDPIAVRKTSDIEAMTFERAAKTVYEELKPTWRNPKHANQWLNTLNQYAFPLIGDRPVGEIATSECLKVLTAIWTEKRETAGRVRQRMKVVFDWAIIAGHRETPNPMTGIEKGLPKQTKKVRHQPSMPWREVPSFFAKLSREHADTTSANALLFLILTAVRSGEARFAVWEEFDLEAGVWTIPAERTKMGRPHRVPLSSRALAIVRGQLENGSRYVFPTPGKDQPLSENAFSNLVKRMHLTGFTPHGFRSSFRDWCSENDVAPWEVAEAALAHQVGTKTEQAYARSDLFDRRRDLMETWDKHVTLEIPQMLDE